MLPVNHMKPWRIDDADRLTRMFEERWSVYAMASDLGRTQIAIQCKLIGLGLVEAQGFDALPSEAVMPLKRPINPLDQLSVAPQPASTHTKEKFMSYSLSIETKTFINGTELSSLSESDLLGMIYKAEQEIAQLDLIEHKPKAVQKKKEALIASIMQLVNLVDSRE